MRELDQPESRQRLAPITGYHFIDEGVEIIKSRSLSLNVRGDGIGQRGGQRATSETSLVILDNSSPSTSATYLSTSATEDGPTSTFFSTYKMSKDS